MERVTISVSDEFAEELAIFMQTHRYDNRSEAIRDLARLGLKQSALEARRGQGHCVATFSYVFNQLPIELFKRLAAIHHAHRELHAATFRVDLDHDNCLQVAVLRGKYPEVRDLANSITAARGVVHGTLCIIPGSAERVV